MYCSLDRPLPVYSLRSSVAALVARYCPWQGGAWRCVKRKQAPPLDRLVPSVADGARVPKERRGRGVNHNGSTEPGMNPAAVASPSARPAAELHRDTAPNDFWRIKICAINIRLFFVSSAWCLPGFRALTPQRFFPMTVPEHAVHYLEIVTTDVEAAVNRLAYLTGTTALTCPTPPLMLRFAGQNQTVVRYGKQ